MYLYLSGGCHKELRLGADDGLLVRGAVLCLHGGAAGIRLHAQSLFLLEGRSTCGYNLGVLI